jgi:hypothetical protein
VRGTAIVPTETPPATGGFYILYRIVHQCPPTLESFRTQREEGLPEPAAELGPEKHWSWQFGVSTFSKAKKARDLARWSQRGQHGLGAFIATLHIPVLGAPILIVKTGGSSHFDLVGDAQAILATYVDCVAV